MSAHVLPPLAVNSKSEQKVNSLPPLRFEPVIFGMLAHLSTHSAKSHPLWFVIRIKFSTMLVVLKINFQAPVLLKTVVAYDRVRIHCHLLLWVLIILYRACWVKMHPEHYIFAQYSIIFANFCLKFQESLKFINTHRMDLKWVHRYNK
jgi:hypothetical protein